MSERKVWLVTSGAKCELSVIGVFDDHDKAKTCCNNYPHAYVTGGNVIEMTMSESQFELLQWLVNWDQASE